MVSIDAQVCWVTNSVCNAGGFIATLEAARILFARDTRRYRNLLWLAPIILMTAWLESQFNAAQRPSPTEPPSITALLPRMGLDLFIWLVFSLGVIALRRGVPRRGSSKSVSIPGAPTGEAIEPLTVRPDGIADPELRGATERFVACVDRGNAVSVAAMYDPEFLCVRVADSGGFARLNREQMLAFLGTAVREAIPSSGSHAVATRDTTLHHAEIIGDFGFVLLTRVKDLGNGWEPLYYNLVWRKQDGEWRLLRELVHQKTAPDWR